MMIKVLIHQEDILMLNVFAPHNRAEKYVQQKQMERKGKTITRNFNIRPSIIVRTTRQKISKDMQVNSTITQQDLINIYRTYHPTTTTNITFKCSWAVRQTSKYFLKFKSYRVFFLTIMESN